MRRITKKNVNYQQLRFDGKVVKALDCGQEPVARNDDYLIDTLMNMGEVDGAQVEAARPAEAEAVYRAGGDDHPFNGWSLFGLEQALRAQGKVGEAEEIAKIFETSWARSDVWIRSSRF